MHEPEFYKGLSVAEISNKVIDEGFDPIRISDPPGHVYPPHSHAETKLLAFLQGGMQVTVNGQSYRCQAGDKLMIPGNVEHSAIVGSGGCVYFWSEKIA